MVNKAGLIRLAFVLFVLLLLVGFAPANAQNIKMSKSKICHDKGSPYYARVKNFKPYATLQGCLNDGGRLPKTSSQAKTKNPVPNDSEKYNRNSFSHWIDEDGDCLNTRHELLMELSTVKAITTDDGCRVLRGRWNDPYSGNIIFDATKMDIDHLVPLSWAWKHGAANWSSTTRKLFANDPVNLFAVAAELNRSKGAQGPESWLPPSTKFHCQYVTRFYRVMLKYEFTESSRDQIRSLRTQICGE